MGLPKRGNGHDNIAAASTDTHKIWLILGIGLAVVLILFLIFYPTAKQAVFGKAVESEFVYIPPLVFYNFDEALGLFLLIDFSERILHGIILLNSH